MKLISFQRLHPEDSAHFESFLNEDVLVSFCTSVEFPECNEKILYACLPLIFSVYTEPSTCIEIQRALLFSKLSGALNNLCLRARYHQV